ncbi:MAG: patatin-like phospholipase family protein [Fibrobacterales bacterium]
MLNRSDRSFISLQKTLLTIFLFCSIGNSKVVLNTTDASRGKLYETVEESAVTHNTSNKNSANESDFSEVEELSDGVPIRPGLFLSGGYEECALHIGILKTIETYKIPIDYVYGSSWGGLIAALWASGHSADSIAVFLDRPEIIEIMKGDSDEGFLQYSAPFGVMGIQQRYSFISDGATKKTLVKTNRTSGRDAILAELIAEKIVPFFYEKGSSYDSLRVPLRIITSDVQTKKPHIHKSGNISKAILATLSNIDHGELYSFNKNEVTNGLVYARFVPDFILEEHEVNWLIAVDASPAKITGINSQSGKERYFRTIHGSQVTGDLYYSDNVLKVQPSAYSGHESFKAIIDKGAALMKSKMDALFLVYGGEFTHKEYTPLSLSAVSKTFKFNQLHLNTLEPQFHSYVHYLLSFYPLTITGSHLKGMVGDLHRSSYYSYPHLSLFESIDSGTVDIEVAAKVQDELTLTGGLFGGSFLYPHAYGAVSYGSVNHFQYTVALQGWIGNFVQGMRGAASFYALGGAPFFFKLSQFYQNIEYQSLMGALAIERNILKEERDSLHVLVGYESSHKGFLYADMFFDNSLFTITDSDTLKEVKVTAFEFGLGGLFNTLNDGEFSTGGIYIDLSGHFKAEGFPEVIGSSAPLHVEGAGRFRRYCSPRSWLHLGFGGSGAVDVDYKQFGKIPEPFTATFSESDTFSKIVEKDTVMSRRFKPTMNTTLRAQYGYDPRFASWGFVNSFFTTGVSWNYLSSWIRLHTMHSFDNGGEYLDGFHSLFIFETVLRFKVRSIELTLFSESQFDTEIEHLIGFQVGTFPF